jgi:ribosomal protein S18 acetylase RimI-like enzyme
MDAIIADKLTDFIQKYLPYTDRDLIKKYLSSHENYGTLDYAIENGGIIGVCRWNIHDDTAEILDLAIDENYRGRGLAKQFLERGLKIWKNVKYLSFVRGKKYPNRQPRKIPIEAVLKRNFF